MGNLSMKKRLFAIVVAAVMILGCTGNVFAATTYTATAEDIAAAKLSEIVVSADDEDDDAEAKALDVNDMKTRDMLALIHAKEKNMILYRIFDVVDVEDGGSKITIVDSGLTSKTKTTVYQYNRDKTTWSKVSASKGDGKLSLKVRNDGPIAVLLPKSAGIPDSASPASYVLTQEDTDALSLDGVIINDDDASIKTMQLDAASTEAKVAFSRFHSQVKKKGAYRVFDAKNTDSEGTRVTVIDNGLNKKQKFAVYQYDKKAQVWKSIGCSKGNGTIGFTLKKDGIVAVTLPAGTSASGSTGAKTGIRVSELTVDSTTDEIRIGGTATLTAAVEPTNLESSITYKWTANSKVAFVGDKTGKSVTIVGKKKGTVSVRVKAGNKSKTYRIKVNPIPVEDITLAEKDITLSIGETRALAPVIVPENATDKKVSYKSDASSIVSVSSKGVLKAKKSGKATITATSKSNKDKYATIEVTVP